MLPGEDRELPLTSWPREGEEDIDMESSANFGDPASRATESMPAPLIFTFCLFVIGMLAVITGAIMLFASIAATVYVLLAGSIVAAIGFLAGLSEI